MDYRGAFWQVILVRDADFQEAISYWIGAQKSPLGLTCCCCSLRTGIFGGELRDLTPDYPSSVKSCLTFSLTLNRPRKGNLWGDFHGEPHLMPGRLSMKSCLSDPENCWKFGCSSHAYIPIVERIADADAMEVDDLGTTERGKKGFTMHAG